MQSNEEQDVVQSLTVPQRKASVRPSLLRGSSKKGLFPIGNDSLDEELNQLRSKLADQQTKIKDYQTQIFEMESMLDRNEMEKNDLQRRLEDRQHLVEEQQKIITELERQKVERDNTIDEYSKSAKRKSVLHSLVKQKKSQSDTSEQQGVEKILLDRIQSLNRQHTLESAQHHQRIEQLEEELRAMHDLKQRYEHTLETNERIEQELDLAQSQIILMQTDLQGWKTKLDKTNRRHTMNQQELLQQLQGGSNANEIQELANKLGKQERVFTWEKDQLNRRIASLEEEVLDLNRQLEERPKAVRQEMELAAQLLLQSEMMEHRKSMQQMQRRHTVQQLHQQEQMNSLEHFVEGARKDRLHELETQELMGRIATLEKEIIGLTEQLHQGATDEIEKLRDQLEQAESNNTFLTHELQSMKTTVQAQKRRMTINQEDIQRMIQPPDLAELRSQLSKQERLFQMERGSLKHRIEALEAEVLTLHNESQQKSESLVNHNETLQQQLEEAESKNTYLEHELQALRTTVSSQKRRMTINQEDLNRLIQPSEDDKLRGQLQQQENEKLQLMARVEQLEQTEEANKSALAELRVLLEQARSGTLQPEVEPSIKEQLKNRVESLEQELLDSRRQAIEKQCGLEQALASMREELNKALKHDQQLKATPSTQNTRMQDESLRNTSQVHDSELPSLTKKPDNAVEELRREFMALQKQQYDFQASITAQFERLSKSRHSSPSVVRQCHPGYEGEQIGFLRHGQGIQHYEETGCTYSGEWRFNKRHGFGELLDSEGNRVYKGEWSFDEMNGNGELHNRGSVIIQEIDSADLRDLSFSRYVGTFSKGELHGQGKVFFPNGDTFEGGISHGVPNGKATYVRLKDRAIIYGIWENGLLVQCEY